MTAHEAKVRVGISCGDLNGIGHEVIIKTFLDTRMLDECLPILYGSRFVSAQHRRILGIPDFSFNPIKDADEANPKRANVVNVWDEEVEVHIGTPTPESGAYALRSLQAAVADLKAGKIDILVTAPIDKQNIQSPEFNFPGHTEYLAQEFAAEEYSMLMLSEQMNVTFMTGHVALSEVARSLTFENIIKKIRFIDRHFPIDFAIRRPRIAVLGLNPHNGDGGVIGREEQEIIVPAIRKAKEDGLLVFGPFAADGFFGSGAHGQFDVILAMYHDQGLIPFKSMNFDRGVNFTAGLPFVRTSPDHGTGFDIAGKGVASEQSFRDAVFTGIDIFNERKRHAEFSAAPLQVQDRRERAGDDRNSGRRRPPGPGRGPKQASPKGA
ncbi:MAG: 4-hydroxythreonine-4-phosphate dehydrogenase PdxA [Flavobacteriales bacterium]|nr:4-hydroxythreonine-4-phosphate dehydrogenase PdxA [Flavobacteriales bacterium]